MLSGYRGREASNGVRETHLDAIDGSAVEL